MKDNGIEAMFYKVDITVVGQKASCEKGAILKRKLL
jgi:hypothetical protein